MMRDLGRAVGEVVFESAGRTLGRAQERRPLPVDVLESDDALLAVFDAPGATGSDVQVRFDQGRLEVRIERFRSAREGFEMVFPGRGLSLTGHVTLPGDVAVDPSAATAELQSNGELHVRVPKRADGDRTDIEITAE